MGTFVRKSFYPKILKWQKVYHQEKKSANLSNCTEAIKTRKISEITTVIIYIDFVPKIFLLKNCITKRENVVMK